MVVIVIKQLADSFTTSTVVSVAAIIILSIIGSLFKVGLPQPQRPSLVRALEYTERRPQNFLPLAGCSSYPSHTISSRI